MVSLDLESMLAPYFLNGNMEAKKGLSVSKVTEVCLIFSQAMWSYITYVKNKKI